MPIFFPVLDSEVVLADVGNAAAGDRTPKAGFISQ